MLNLSDYILLDINFKYLCSSGEINLEYPLDFKDFLILRKCLIFLKSLLKFNISVILYPQNLNHNHLMVLNELLLEIYKTNNIFV